LVCQKRIAQSLIQVIAKTRKRVSHQDSVFWPSIEEEIGDYKEYLKGRVLNAGSGIPVGDRDISHLVDGELFNQDIVEHSLIQITSPLEQIPVDDQFFDCVFCNAVLEHVINPDEVLSEFFRVLKTGGYLYVAVPFIQPEHLCPVDYQRYTLDGLKNLVEKPGFEIVDSGGVHNVYRTLGWIVEEWLTAEKSIRNSVLKAVLFPVLRSLSANSNEYVHSISSVYRVLAKKP
jgi:SAM-dependent methyltransferase